MMTQDDFRELLIRCRSDWERSDDIMALENTLISILEFMKENISERDYFIDILEKIVDGTLDYPIEIVEFSMRYFQWEEVKNYCIGLTEKTNDIDAKHFYQRIISVYDKDWKNQDLYEYYNGG